MIAGSAIGGDGEGVGVAWVRAKLIAGTASSTATNAPTKNASFTRVLVLDKRDDFGVTEFRATAELLEL